MSYSGNGGATLLNITIRQLQVFVSVVETGGFGLAADHLNIAQTSVSAHIAAIEEQLGRAVFVRRSGRKPVLTDFGDMLLSRAQVILSEVDALTSQLHAEQSRFAEQIVFACQRSIAHAILPAVLARFTRDHPTVELITRVGSQEEVIDDVRDGIADLGCFLSYEAPGFISSEAIGTERYVLIANRQHPLAARDAVRPEEVERCAFVWPPQGSRFGKSLTQILNHAGVRHMMIVSRATDYEVFRELVLAGVGITCSAEKSAAPDIEAGHLAVLPLLGPPLTMKVRLTVSETKPVSASVRQFIELVRAHWR